MIWQPIDTAPKNGVDLLLCFEKDYLPFTGNFSDGYWRSYEYDERGDNVCDPTHWMSLPETPEMVDLKSPLTSNDKPYIIPFLYIGEVLIVRGGICFSDPETGNTWVLVSHVNPYVDEAFGFGTRDLTVKKIVSSYNAMRDRNADKLDALIKAVREVLVGNPCKCQPPEWKYPNTVNPECLHHACDLQVIKDALKAFEPETTI